MEKFSKVLGHIYQRNSSWFDVWSVIHLLNGVLLSLLLNPFFALAIMVLWEPLEVLVLSPWLRRKYGLIFGFETIRNSLSDIFFDTVGVTAGFLLLKLLEAQPILLR